MNLRQFLEVLKRHKWLIIGATVVVGLVAGILSGLRTPMYQSTAQVFLRPNNPAEQINPQSIPGLDVNTPDRYVAAQEDIVNSPDVAARAATSLPGLTPQAIQSSISVKQSGASDVLDISARDTNATQARDIANAVAKSYIENRRLNAVAGLQTAAADVKSRLADLQKQIADLDARIGGAATPRAGGQPSSSVALTAARDAATVQYQSLFASEQDLLVNIDLNRGEAELIALAETPTAPTSPKPKRDAALGAFGGLILAVGVVFLREKLNDKIQSRHDVAQLTGLPVLAELPRDPAAARAPNKLVVLEAPNGPLAEAARTLRTSLDFLGVDRPLNRIIVTSPGPGDGKTLTAASLAVVYAQAGHSTILVSADLRHPRLASLFDSPEDGGSSRGLTDIILATADLPVDPASNGSSPNGGAHWRGRAVVAGRRSPPDRSSGFRAPAPALAVQTAGRSVVQDALSPTRLPNLVLLRSGALPPNPAELLASSATEAVLAELSILADVVIIDTPPVLAVTDAAVLGGHADGVLLVTAFGNTPRGAVQRAQEVLEATGSHLLGLVLNKVEPSRKSYYHVSDMTQ